MARAPTKSLLRYFQSYYRTHFPSIGAFETHSRQSDVEPQYEGPWMLQQRSFKHDRADTSRNIDVPPQANPGSTPPSGGGPTISNWMKLAIGSIFTFLLPFLYAQWKNIQTIAEEVETAKEAVEKTAEVVEKVAEMADKASKEAAQNLKDGKFKAAVEAAEHIFEKVEEDARIVEDIIHKEDEIEEDVKTLIEPSKHDNGNKKQDEKDPKKSPMKANRSRI